MFRFFATILSFFLILGGYYLYGWVLVPNLLPPHEVTKIEARVEGPTEAPEEFKRYLPLFAEGSWERDPEKVQLLVIGRTVALFQEDEIEGSVARLKPCSLILLPDDEDLSDKEQIRQAIVLQTPGHAEIDFDGELNFSRFPLPKMKGGKLIGPVVIRSDMQDPGVRDDFFLETENVVFTDAPAATTIDTLKDVRFRFGYNTGEGTVLNLTMGLSNPKNPKSRKVLNQVRFDRLKQLNLVFPDDDSKTDQNKTAVARNVQVPEAVPADPKTKVAGSQPAVPPLVPPLDKPDSMSPTAADGTKKDPVLFSAMHDPARYSIPIDSATRVDIVCQREFQFLADKEPDSWNAVFEGEVQVDRINPDGSKDRLTCEKLLVNFRPKTVSEKDQGKPKPVNSPSGPEESLGSLEPASLHALGKLGYGNQAPVPARLVVKQNGNTEMEGDHIVYDLRKNLMMIKTDEKNKNNGASREVRMLVQDRYRIVSQTGFDYVPGKDGKIGTLTSVGPGNLRGNIGDEKTPKNIFLSWNAMRISPDKIDPKQVLIELKDGISVEAEEFGKMTAKHLQLWCFVENEKNTAGGKKQTTTPVVKGAPSADGAFGSGGTLIPDRATVMEDVRFQNARGVCIVKKLGIFFETASEKEGVHRSRWVPQLLTGPAPQTKNLGLSNISSANVPSEKLPSGQSPIRQVRYDSQDQSAPVRLASFPPTPGAAPTKKPASTQSQNLLGIGSSGGTSVYEIVGDQMKMNVCREGNKSYVERIWIGGNVRIQEKISGQKPSDTVEITGDEVWVWYPDSPNTTIRISGRETVDSASALRTESQYAVFSGKGIVMKAFNVFIFRTNDRAHSQIHVDGPGRLVASSGRNSRIQIAPGVPQKPVAAPGGMNPLTPLAPLSPDPKQKTDVQEEEDGPLIVEWNKEMLFDGQTLMFLGTPDQNGNRVMGSYQTRRNSYRVQRLYCDTLMIHLNRFISLFDDDASGDVVEANIVECINNVYIESELFDDSGREKKSYERGRFEAIQIELKTNVFSARGPGQMFSTSPDTGKGFAVKQGLPGGLKSDPGTGELSFLGVWFSDSIQGLFVENRKNATIRGRVKTVYCPVQSWKDELDLTQLTAATRRGYLLECDQMEIAQMPDPADARKSTMELTARKNARVEGNTFYGKAETIKYNQAKSLIIFDGNAWVTSENEELPAQRIEYNIDTGAMKMSHAQGFSSGK